jgi:hypothetical protein
MVIRWYGHQAKWSLGEMALGEVALGETALGEIWL